MKDWWRRRQKRRAQQARARGRLHDEYAEKVASGDPDALESGRDYGDHDGTPWRAEVSMGLAGVGILALIVVVAVLAAVFQTIKVAIG